MLQMFWAARHRQIIPLDFPMSWLERDNLSMMALWDDRMGRCLCQHSSSTIDDVKLDFHVNRYERLFTWPGKNNIDLFVDLATGQAYKVDDETDLIHGRRGLRHMATGGTSGCIGSRSVRGNKEFQEDAPQRSHLRRRGHRCQVGAQVEAHD